MMMVSYLDQLFISLTGHSYMAQAGEPIDIRSECVKEAMTRGFIPVNKEEFKEAETVPPTPQVEAPNGSDRDAAIITVLKDIALANRRFDFLASGFPKRDLVERKLGFDLERGEIERLWTQMRAKAA